MLIIPEGGNHDVQTLTDELVAFAQERGIHTYREELVEGTPDTEAGVVLNDDDRRCFERFSFMAQCVHGAHLCIVNHPDNE